MSRRNANVLVYISLALGIIAGLLIALPPSANRLLTLAYQGPSALLNDPVLMVGVVLWVAAILCAAIGKYHPGKGGTRQNS